MNDRYLDADSPLGLAEPHDPYAGWSLLWPALLLLAGAACVWIGGAL